jgi:hypothetical protein
VQTILQHDELFYQYGNQIMPTDLFLWVAAERYFSRRFWSQAVMDGRWFHGAVMNYLTRRQRHDTL